MGQDSEKPEAVKLLKVTSYDQPSEASRTIVMADTGRGRQNSNRLLATNGCSKAQIPQPVVPEIFGLWCPLTALEE
jgi:hypothetical protein